MDSRQRRRRWFWNLTENSMDISKFIPSLYNYEDWKYHLYFDFSWTKSSIKRIYRGRKFQFHETLLKFLSQNPTKKIFITELILQHSWFEIDWANIIININEFQRFCFWLGPRIDRANAFFRQDVSIENLTLTWATEAQILEWIKSLSSDKKEEFLSKIGWDISIVSMSDSQLLKELKNRKIWQKEILLFIDWYSKEEINEFGEKIDMTRVNMVLKFWEEHNKSAKEIAEWQPFFKKNFWVIGQIFASPVIIYDDEFYAWWISQWSRKWGKLIDFVGKNKFSNNISIIEIKTPVDSLVQKKEYWGRGWIYPMHNDLMWAISQVLDQKNKTIQDYKHDNKWKEHDVLNPRAILIIGSESNDKLEWDRQVCFDLYKNSQRDVDIVTYDELFYKVQALKDLLTK